MDPIITMIRNREFNKEHTILDYLMQQDLKPLIERYNVPTGTQEKMANGLIHKVYEWEMFTTLVFGVGSDKRTVRRGY